MNGRTDGRLTFFGQFHCADEIVDEVLQIAQRIRDARRSVDLRQGRVEDRDDIFEKLSSRALWSKEWSSTPA